MDEESVKNRSLFYFDQPRDESYKNEVLQRDTPNQDERSMSEYFAFDKMDSSVRRNTETNETDNCDVLVNFFFYVITNYMLYLTRDRVECKIVMIFFLKRNRLKLLKTRLKPFTPTTRLIMFKCSKYPKSCKRTVYAW